MVKTIFSLLLVILLHTSIPEQMPAGYNPTETSLLVRLSFIGYPAG
ncbi:hypothetical protein [Moorella sulfitireducens (nom. illeg.)]|nr:hypothetical protein [Moorella sulfitireducens]